MRQRISEKKKNLIEKIKKDVEVSTRRKRKKMNRRLLENNQLNSHLLRSNQLQINQD